MARPQVPLNAWGKINFTKAPGGGWTARGRFRDYTGKKHDWLYSAKTKASAEEGLRAKADDYLPPSDSGMSGAMTVEALFNQWLAQRQKDRLSHNTIQDYLQVWRLHLADRFGSLSVREMTTGGIHAHISLMTPSNSRRARVVLKGMFDYAERFDVVTRNPVRATSYVKAEPKEIKALDPSDIDRARAAFRHHDDTRRGPKGFRLSDFFDIMLGTGLRPGELLALQWPNVDLHHKGDRVTVTVEGTLSYRDGKSRGPLVKTETPKTASSARTILVPEFVAEIFRRLHAERRITPSNAVLTTSTGNFVALNNVNRAIRRLRDDIDLSWMTSHTFRKTAATWVTETLGEEQAFRLLGHAGPEVTRGHYIDKTRFTGDATTALETLGPDARSKAQTHDGEDNGSAASGLVVL